MPFLLIFCSPALVLLPILPSTSASVLSLTPLLLPVVLLPFLVPLLLLGIARLATASALFFSLPIFLLFVAKASTSVFPI